MSTPEFPSKIISLTTSNLAYEEMAKYELDSENWPNLLELIICERDLQLTHHANGFKKFRIKIFPDDSVLRLHIWTSNISGNIHNHRWDFKGTVLQGKLLEHCYEATDNFDSGSMFKIFNKFKNQLVTHEECGLYGVSSINELSESAIYTRKSHLLHHVVAKEENTVTLVATAPPNKGVQPIVISPIDFPPKSDNRAPKKINKMELFKVITELRNKDTKQ